MIDRRATIALTATALTAVATALAASPAAAAPLARDARAVSPEVLTAAAPAAAAAAPVDPVVLAAERVVQLANAGRAAAGCPALAPDPLLAAAAAGHSADMAARRVLTHTGVDGSTPLQRIHRAGFHAVRSAENAAAGYATADDVVRAWLDSPGHRRNLLDCRLDSAGVGLAGDPAAPYWTLALAARG
ncbi:uncharacterized protein YkwD [Kineococcus xinjiangensis]|uniref:Uncharacterized protein YkwD n=1 Tax=Kineococcus xinjiangensis TaxID=512762 RepID=A0A2S6IFU9_9ACTN|nr:CAP domain-containing protein [Kineococcus xinjiangensis]PPK93088.1 uncharacterized protein YkwD [Kineococcus xinjiangensis]